MVLRWIKTKIVLSRSSNKDNINCVARSKSSNVNMNVSTFSVIVAQCNPIGQSFKGVAEKIVN